jgi:hypothetical protein
MAVAYRAGVREVDVATDEQIRELDRGAGR